MTEEDDLGPGGPLGPVLGVLIAQLSRNGALTTIDRENMCRRLIEGGNPELADAINMIVLSDLLDDPHARRASLFSIDGGNSEG